MMEFNEFKEEILRRIAEEFSGYSILEKQILKDNGVYLTGIEIREPGNNVAPMFYADNMYEAYQSGGTMDQIIDSIRVTLSKSMPFDIANISKEFVLKNARLVAVNTERNAERLKETPSFSNLGISFVPRCILNESLHGSFVINRSLLNSFGITEDEIMEAAKKNTVEDLQIKPLTEMLKSMGFPIPEIDAPAMYIVTNSAAHFGAGALGCPEALEKIGEKMGGDFAAIPSSVHELIVLPAADVPNVRGIIETISYVNETQVSETEYLSNNLFFYSAEEKVLKFAEEEDLDKEMD